MDITMDWEADFRQRSRSVTLGRESPGRDSADTSVPVVHDPMDVDLVELPRASTHRRRPDANPTLVGSSSAIAQHHHAARRVQLRESTEIDNEDEHIAPLIPRQHRPVPAAAHPDVIIISDDDEEVIFPAVLQQHAVPPPVPRHPVYIIDDRPQAPAVITLDHYYRNGMTIRPGDFVEFIPRDDDDDGFSAQFLHVQAILPAAPIPPQAPTPMHSGIQLLGIPYTRTRNTRNLLSPKLNEVAAILTALEDDARPLEEQAAILIDAAIVLRKRRLQRTNAPFGAGCPHRARVGRFSKHKTKARAEERGVLTTRWKIIICYGNDVDRRNRRKASVTTKVVRLRERDVADAKLRVSDRALVHNWRGPAGNVRGGSHGGTTAANNVVVDLDRDDNDRVRITQAADQAYTFGDLFCGASGTSRGAQMAGFRVRLACDMSPEACATYRLNFPDARLGEAELSDFLHLSGLTDAAARVDVLHMSPPCQTWSPNHTRAGRDDDFNAAALSSCLSALKKCRPRIATLEQTFGLGFDRFAEHLNSLISDFTTLDYSVQWKVVRCDHLGVPQPRKRFILIAAGPGESLPPFPSRRPGPPPTVARALDLIRRSRRPVTLHNPGELLRSAARDPLWRQNHPPYDVNCVARRTITTDGGGPENYHPSGMRKFTLREYAALQTFPVRHRFAGTDTGIKKQIGNAFPPAAVQCIYACICSGWTTSSRTSRLRMLLLIELESTRDDGRRRVVYGQHR